MPVQIRQGQLGAKKYAILSKKGVDHKERGSLRQLKERTHQTQRDNIVRSIWCYARVGLKTRFEDRNEQVQGLRWVGPDARQNQFIEIFFNDFSKFLVNVQDQSNKKPGFLVKSWFFSVCRCKSLV